MPVSWIVQSAEMLGSMVEALGSLAMVVGAAVAGTGSRSERTLVVDPESPDHAVDAELHRLAKGLSHDLAGPLRSLSVALEMVEEDLENGDTEDVLGTLAVVRNQAQQLSRMTGDLVEYCRTAWRPHRPMRIELRSTVSRLVAGMDVSVMPQVELNILDATVVVEVEALTTVLQVVVENAFLHRGSGTGIVRISASVHDDEERSWLMMTVEDDGQGIPTEMHDAVFAIFRRSTSSAEGSGVGLFLAQTLIWRVGGHIRIATSELGGACVELRWPLRRADEGEAVS